MSNITKKERDFFIACALGSSFLDKSGCLHVTHLEKDKDLFLYKSKQLGAFLLKSSITRVKINGKTYFKFVCKSNKFTKLVRKIVYPFGYKSISPKLLRRSGVVGLALWYMESGSYSLRSSLNGTITSSSTVLNTQLSKEANQILIDYYKAKYNLYFNQRKNKNRYALICGTKEGIKFYQLIGNFVLPCYHYKLSK